MKWQAQFDIEAKEVAKGNIGLNRLLIDILPEAYGVATGEIIPFNGETSSPQCDTIIYDRLHNPVIGRSDAVKQIPLEGRNLF